MEGAAAAEYQWFADDEEIEGADEATLLITEDMVGAIISVKATAEDMEEATATCTEAVGVYDELEILTAEQKKKDQVHVTFSAPFSLLDELTVTKGTTEKTIAAVLPDDDKLGATLTMKDALATGTYTVTLTPADATVDPSSVTFEAEAANKAARIEILGDYLVMKNTDFNEGYCFIKGYNQFDEEVTLSGLTVNAAPSSSTQYDSSTGKLTVKSTENNQYAIIKQVTVYAQAMVDSKAVIAQKTLEVSSIGYPAEVEFGEITKDATNVPDISDGISINEINSGLYYIPVLSVKDNYGNDMLAKDLNYLDQKNLLTTVPTDDKSLYFSVRKEGSVFTEKDGKIVIFLGGGNGKPGTFNFLMTSAGGQFEKEVTIKENPFIDTLQVTVPDIYEYEETDEFGLVGYDQDGNELDLYEYLQAGQTPDGKLRFIDKQNLTESATVIDAGDNGNWRVQKFADTKTYKVTFVPNANVKARGIITFVTTTASFNTDTQMATVGARGTSGNISSELKNAASAPYDFNQNLQFLDANGKLMDRAHNTQYPTFVPAGMTVSATLIKDQMEQLTDEKIAAANHDDNDNNNFGFYYVVSKQDKTTTTNWESVTQNTGTKKNGVAPSEGQYYVFLIANQAVDGAHDLTNTAKTRILDSRTFYVSNSQAGDVPVSYTAKVSGTLYTGKKYADEKTVKVTVTYRNGVTKDFDASGLALDGGFKVNGNAISKGTVEGDGSTTVSVYLAEVTGTEGVFTNDGAVATCTLTYSDDDPVGTSVDFKREVQVDANCQNYGTTWKEDETETVWDLTKAHANSKITVEDGALTMTNGNEAGDTYYMTVKDQYGNAMTDAKYYVNGKEVRYADAPVVDRATEKVLEIKGQSKGSEVSKTWRVNVPTGVEVTSEDKTDYTSYGTATATTGAQLKKTLAAAALNHTPDIITFDGIDDAETTTTMGAEDTLVIAAGSTLTAAQNVTMTGNVENNGTLITTGGVTVANGKKFTNNGNLTINGAIATTTTSGSFENNGTITGLTTLTVAAGTTFKNTADLTLGGIATVNGKLENSAILTAGANNITVDGDGTDTGVFTNTGTVNGTGKISGTGSVINKSGATIDLGTVGEIDMTNMNTLHNSGTVKAKDIKGFVAIESSKAVTTASNSYTATTIIDAEVKAVITQGAATLTLDNTSGEDAAIVQVKSMTKIVKVNDGAAALQVSGTSDGTTPSVVTVLTAKEGEQETIDGLDASLTALTVNIATANLGSTTELEISSLGDIRAAGVSLSDSGWTVTDASGNTGVSTGISNAKIQLAAGGVANDDKFTVVIPTTNGNKVTITVTVAAT